MKQCKKKVSKKENVQKFLSRHIFVRSAAQKKSTNSLLGSAINLEKTPVIFVHRISAHRGNNPAQYSRNRNRNYKNNNNNNNNNRKTIKFIS